VRIAIPVRPDDLDTNGHVRGAAYVLYADAARWKLVHEAGVDVAALAERGFGPVNLRTAVDYRAELRMHDTVEVTTEWHWPGGKTARIVQRLWRGDTLVADVESVSGLMDLTARKLVAEPEKVWRTLVTRPELMGLQMFRAGPLRHVRKARPSPGVTPARFRRFGPFVLPFSDGV
jgi:acyl-CoA thioester hydrolase